MFRSFVVRAATATAVAVASVAATGNAAQAQDRLALTGQVGFTRPGGGSTVFVDFANTVFANIGSTGVFSTVTPFTTTGPIQDITLSSATANGLSVASVPSFLTIGGYTFTLTSAPTAPAAAFNVGPFAVDPSANGSIASFSVVGTVTGGALGTSTRTFTGLFNAIFDNSSVADVTGSLGTGTRVTNFQAGLTLGPVAVIPEPSTYALMATGVAMLGLLAYRRRQQA